MSRNLLAGKTQRPDLTASADRHLSRDALFGLSKDGPQIVEVDIDSILPNPHQPRRSFDESELRRLADSIERDGLQQPIGVQRLPDERYQLAFGERRLRAVKLLGRTTIFGVLVKADADVETLAIVENLQRTDLSPFELADAYHRLATRHRYSHARIAQLVGSSKSEVTRTMAIAGLPDAIRQEFDAIKPTMKALRDIAQADSDQERLKRWEAYKASLLAVSAPPPPGVPADDAGTVGSADAGDPAQDPGTRPARRTADGYSSHLPKRAARHIRQAQEVLATLTAKPLRRSLSEDDRRVLRELRQAADALLAQ